MKIHEFTPDDSFLEDLRNGRFCLVLGAGFSFGIDENNRIKNKTNHHNPLYQHLPLTSEFIEITRLEFKEFNKGVIDFPNAVILWENAIVHDDKKKELFRNLFLVDIEDFNKRFLHIYKCILIPNWYRVFTFNFDDVFECICKNKEYRTLSYPNDKEFTSNASKEIAHVHGRITEDSNLTDLVFFGNKYAALAKSQNDLYFALLNSVDLKGQNKGLIVVGCQFNEIIQIQKFYSEILSNGLSEKPRIIQFDIAEPVLSGDRSNIDYTFIESSTSQFLQFLHAHRSKIEDIQIEGAQLINSDFLDNIKAIGTQRNYKADDFYLAKQYDVCQWWGITNNWDVERDAYQRIKKEATDAFNDDFRQPKIAAFIYGRGGSGKSTLLRRLAYDLKGEDFAVLWLNDKGISGFYENGLVQLNSYPYKKFLILIEDWYRIRQNLGQEKAREIINGICGYLNVRVVIGDRTIDDSISKEHFYNPKGNQFELLVDENQKTINAILEKVPHWKPVAEQLLFEPKDYKTSLYLILWVIARTYQKETDAEKSNITRENIAGHFQSIIQSDLRAIEKHYPGLAKMLYYWACIYSECRIYMGFDFFLTLADFFNEGKGSVKNALASDEIRPLLDIYVNKAEGLVKSAGQLPLIAFNHDVLSDDGVAKSKLSNWHKFDDSIKLQILPRLFEHADDFSASSFLWYFLQTVAPVNITNEEKLNYINALYEKGNRGEYLNHLFYNNDILTDIEKNSYAERILIDYPKNNYQVSTIYLCLNQLKNLPAGEKAAKAILSQPDLFRLPKEIVSTAMNIPKDDAERKKAASAILSQPDFFKLSFQIVSTAMNISKDDAERKKAASAILSQPDFFKLSFQIVSTAMNISKDDAERKKAATVILSQPEFFKLPKEIVSTAMNISKDDAERKKAATAILSQSDIFKLPKEIVSTAMNISKDDTERKKAATAILSQPDFFKLPHDIVCTAMNVSKDDTERKKAATVILSQPDFFKLPNDIVCTAMNVSKDDAERKKAATVILSQPEFFKLPKEIVSTAMNVSKDDTERKKAATVILSQPDFFKLPNDIVCTAMNVSKDDTERKKAATAILSQPDFFKLSFQIVSTAMNISKDDTERKKAASVILSQPEFFKLPKEIVSTAMNVSKDDTERKKAATVILSQPEFFKLPNDIVCTAMNVSKDDAERKKAATVILSQPEFFKLPKEIVCTAMNVSKDLEKATYFLRDWKNTGWSIIFQSLFCYADAECPPKVVSDIINTIIEQHRKDKKFYFYYNQILKIPFRKIRLWAQTCDRIIYNYNCSINANRALIYHVLLSHRSYPDKIKEVCKTILIHWEHEISNPIKTLRKGVFHYGNHIKLALGHPELKVLASQKALEIKQKGLTLPDYIPPPLLETANQIIDENKYPEWTKE